FDRPGWLRCEQFGAGMITGWGAHHVDSAHWGMNTEYTGPVEIWGTAEFPTHGLWDVHGKFLTRTENVTASDPATGAPASARLKETGLDASDPAILDSAIGPDEIHLYVSKEHHRNWLDSVRTRQANISPVEMGHRACSTCLLHHMAMKAKRHLKWDPERETFPGDAEANSWLSRPQRKGYTLEG